jgi:hypothetical protein
MKKEKIPSPPFSWNTAPVYQMFADDVRFKDEDVTVDLEKREGRICQR